MICRRLLRRLLCTSASLADYLSAKHGLYHKKLLMVRPFLPDQFIVQLLLMMCLYPFLQKYFVKGVTLGATKE